MICTTYWCLIVFRILIWAPITMVEVESTASAATLTTATPPAPWWLGASHFSSVCSPHTCSTEYCIPAELCQNDGCYSDAVIVNYLFHDISFEINDYALQSSSGFIKAPGMYIAKTKSYDKSLSCKSYTTNHCHMNSVTPIIVVKNNVTPIIVTQTM